ncbi:MAG: hypothetical protein ACQGVC_05910 [Myxococcota bacterium]
MIQYDFDPERSFTRVFVSGELEDAAMLPWFRRFLDDLRGAERVSGIVDTRSVTHLKVTGETVRQMTRLVETREQVFAGSRWGLVANRDALFGMARMYQLMRDQAPYEICVFRDMDAAREWFEEEVGAPGPPGRAARWCLVES